MAISWFWSCTAGAGVISQTGPSSTVLGKFLVDGGWITWLVLVPLSVVSIALIIHYLIVLRRSTQVPAGLAKALVLAARRGQARDIIEITREDETMLGQAAFAGIARLPAGRETARAAISEAIEEQATRLLRRIEYLNVIGNISPMIGLFGTVVGMINAFGRIYSAGGGMPDAAKLAGDISVALITTFWGLLIAIPALSVFSLLRNRIDAFAAESVKLCDSLVSLLCEQQAGASKAAG
ncbi:MAG: MotA/TolQ/ExbB proton channel family protein [Phycisphaerae bacterium]